MIDHICPKCGSTALETNLINSIIRGQPDWTELRDLLGLPSTDCDKQLVIQEIKDLNQRIKNQAGVISGMQADRDAMEDDLESLEHTLGQESKEQDRLYDENQDLKRWKAQAIETMPPYQEIAEALGLKVGDSIHDKILPGIQRLKTFQKKDEAEANELSEKLMEAEAEIKRLKDELWMSKLRVDVARDSFREFERLVGDFMKATR